MLSPLEQFEITPIKGLFYVIESLGLSVTNFTLFVFLAIMALIILLILTTFYTTLVPNAGQFFFESIYMFIYNMMASNLEFENHKYFPYIFTIFIFILTSNILGLLPYSYTLTSQIMFTFFLALSSFIALIYIGLKHHGLNFLGIFFPPEAPLVLAFLLVPIEIISFFSRPFSLAIRLFANMTAGHVLLKILTGFVIVIVSLACGYLPDLNNLFKLLTSGFYGLGELFLPSTESFELKFAIFTNYYINYDINLIYSLPMYYYSNLFKVTDILDSADEPPQDVIAWYATVTWYHLFLVNYLAPVIGKFTIAEDSQFYYDYLNLIFLNFSSPQSQHIAAIFHNSHFFYMGLPSHSPYLLYFYMLNLHGLILDNYSSMCINISPMIYPIQLFFSIASVVLTTLLPITIIVFFIFLEFFVSILQAYVFTILLVIYLRDVTELH